MNYTTQQINQMNELLRKACRILQEIGHTFVMQTFELDGHLLWKMVIDDDTDVAVTLDHGIELYYSPTELTDGHLTLELVVMRVLEYLNQNELYFNQFKKPEA